MWHFEERLRCIYLTLWCVYYCMNLTLMYKQWIFSHLALPTSSYNLLVFKITIVLCHIFSCRLLSHATTDYSRCALTWAWAPRCTSNAHSIWINCVHMNALYFNAHPKKIWCTSIESTYTGGHSHRIVLLFMIHVRIRLPWDCWLALWLGLWHVLYCSFLFCSCGDVVE